jgi:hypothetical protein
MMKKIICFALVVFIFKINASSQEYYKIVNTSHVIRYYSNSKDNTEFINDSISMKLSRQGQLFYVTLIDQEGKSFAGCRYRFNNKYENRVFLNRGKTNDGNELVKSKKKIRLLEPLKNNCIKDFLKM